MGSLGRSQRAERVPGLNPRARSADYLRVNKTLTRRSRAVVRTIEPGNTAVCVACDTPVKFTARQQLRQVIANVYVKGKWDRVEHFHDGCYVKAREPYGSPAS